MNIKDVGQAAWSSFSTPWSNAFGAFNGDNDQHVSIADLVLPGSTALTQMLDINGSRAASRQASSQLALDNAAREFSSNEAQKQRDWEKMMSDTAVRRAAADYKAAGLNPWLAVQHGGFGAATPVGSSAQSNAGQANKADNKLTLAAGLIATALRIFLTKK